MKILQFEEFLEMPEGTVFVERRADLPLQGPLCRKGTGKIKDQEIPHFEVIVPITSDQALTLFKKSDFPSEYLVFEKEDVEELIRKLQ